MARVNRKTKSAADVHWPSPESLKLPLRGNDFWQCGRLLGDRGAEFVSVPALADGYPGRWWNVNGDSGEQMHQHFEFV